MLFYRPLELAACALIRYYVSKSSMVRQKASEVDPPLFILNNAAK